MMNRFLGAITPYLLMALVPALVFFWLQWRAELKANAVLAVQVESLSRTVENMERIKKLVDEIDQKIDHVTRQQREQFAGLRGSLDETFRATPENREWADTRAPDDVTRRLCESNLAAPALCERYSR